jgi:hypothetical protein
MNGSSKNGGTGGPSHPETPFMDSMMRISSNALQGFFIGSIFGFTSMNRPRRPEDMLHPTGKDHAFL